MSQAPEHTTPEDWLHVDSLGLDARGVARRAGKVIFIEGALPGELVSARTTRRKEAWEAATLTAIHRESTLRVAPRCPHFGLHQGACGGCLMQHVEASAQVAIKQRALEDALWHLGRVRPARMLRPLQGPAWGYRWRARLSVRFVVKRGEVLIGFHERKSRYIADMPTCAILPPHVSALLLPLRALIAEMDARDACPQIELACGEGATALALRHLTPLSDADKARLRAFAAAHSDAGVQWWLQPKGPDTLHPLDEGDNAPPPLHYRLPEFGLTMPFRPADFTQVNPHINQVLVSRALRLLAVQPGERVIDWFCGLGNFTLPIATQAAEVLGVEGNETLVQRARANYEAARATRALGKAAFAARNLFDMTADTLRADGTAARWLIDPPREGALALVKALAALRQPPPEEKGQGDWQPPQRIVYVSCNPATLARDAGLLVHQAGYRCAAACVLNMFPHTAHVESLAVFDLDNEWQGIDSSPAS